MLIKDAYDVSAHYVSFYGYSLSLATVTQQDKFIIHSIYAFYVCLLMVVFTILWLFMVTYAFFCQSPSTLLLMKGALQMM